jgi:hypothetical protein
MQLMSVIIKAELNNLSIIIKRINAIELFIWIREFIQIKLK